MSRVDIYFKAMIMPEYRKMFKIFEYVHMIRTSLYINVFISFNFKCGEWSQQILIYLYFLVDYYFRHIKLWKTGSLLWSSGSKCVCCSAIFFPFSMESLS